MAVGIGLAGDNQIGWRIMSTLFGSITCVGMYFLALVLFKTQEAALWAAGLTLVNQLLYVQSRIGMLDTFMMAFLIWAMVAFFSTWLPTQNRWKNATLLRCMGALFGLTIACKWFGLVAWGASVILVLGISLIQKSPLQSKLESNDSWYSKDLWRDVSWMELVLSFFMIPALFYFATYIPYLFLQDGQPHSPLDWFGMQSTMYDGQLRVITNHPYNSNWKGWALMIRPIWYAFEPELGDPTQVRGVLLLGNPIIMWLGLVALVACLVDGLFNRRRQGFLIAYFWCAFYLCWSIIPRTIAFYYYYYPAGMMLTFALTHVFFSWQDKAPGVFRKVRNVFLVACLGMFIYFFPILAGFKISSDSFRSWTWFTSWI